ncbi:hypothetical protein FRC00_012426 [Tulasnella sp. 408]|nr:hypothetical protein FRC00_012426 [Tulasnella sp. 408]
MDPAEETAIRKIPTFAPLVFSNLFGYSTLDPSDQSALTTIDTGAGAGGGPLASRLAAEGWRTLVIEAGKDHVTFNTTIPLYLIQATEDPEISLDYYVNHYPKGTKYGDVKTWYPRSQGLGGCTIHNALINLIPHKWDFEQLQNMFNDETWGWQNMAKYYSRVENNLWLPNGLGLPIGHGYRGWLSTQLHPTSLLTDYPDQQLVDLVTAIRTGREPVVNEDYNDWRNDEAQGGSWITLTKQANGTRSSVRNRLMEVHNQNPRLLKFPFETHKWIVTNVEGSSGLLTFGTLAGRVEETTLVTLKKPHIVFQNCTFGYDPAKNPCLAKWFANGRKNLYAAGAALYAWGYKSSLE